MKIKSDFVTNSSSTNYIVDVEIKTNNDLTHIFKDLSNKTMVDVILKIEKQLDKWNFKNGTIILNEEVTDLCCDGWDYGDYQFSGNGGAFLGISNLAIHILTKIDVIVEVKDGKLVNYPESWNYEGSVWMDDILKVRGIKGVAELFNLDQSYIKLLEDELADIYDI